MRKRSFCLLTLLIISVTLTHAQSRLNGQLADSVQGKSLRYASVVLLRASDSVLYRHTRAVDSGFFSLEAAPGRYVFVVTFPGFADYSDSLLLGEQPLSLGRIFLTPKSKILEEIIVKRSIPAIRMKGDTVVYKADSFRVQPGASVEDLLKKLPGITVDRNGNITAQGERVRKILVDGEEFFSDDPTIATRNLQSAMVDELEVFDKKSDQAEFTGIDDGQRTKTLNLKLKEDKKNGYFGKVEAGSNGNDYWSNSAMLNYFKGKKKIAGHGLMASDGRTGLNFQEMMNYGGVGNMESEMNEGGGMSISIETPDEDSDWGRFEGEGLPRSWSAGGQFSNKWDNERKNLNANYRFKKLNNDAQVTNRSQYILPDTTFFVNERSRVSTSRLTHNVQSTFDIKLDSSSSIKLMLGGVLGNGRNSQLLETESLNPLGDTINNGRRQNTAETGQEGFNGSLTYRKKFKKPGQTFSANLRTNYRLQTSDGFLQAGNQFYDSKGVLVREDLIDQSKVNRTRQENYSGRLSYTQPVNKRTYLEFNYQLANAQNRSLRKTFEKASPSDDKYEVLVPALSNDFLFDSWTHTGGMNIRVSKSKKYSVSLGGSVSSTNLDQQDLIRDTSLRYNFVNFFPQATLNLTMKKNTNLYLTYRGSTEQPSVNMLQPVADNTDPLNVFIGNPNLDLALQHNLYLWLNRYDMLSESGFFLNYSLNVSQDAFSNRNFIDSLGRRIYQTVNVDGVYNNRLYFNYNKKLKKPEINIGFGPEFTFGQNVNIVNEETNRILNGQIGLNVNANYTREKKFSLGFNAFAGYNFSRSSIRNDIETNYWLQSYSVNYGIQFAKKWELGGDFNAQLRQRTEAFPDNNNALLWNMWLDRKFGKKDDVKLRLFAFDILNENIGFRRTINSNLVSERTYNTFNRYLMLSLIWNFNKNGKPVSW